jgi:ubiquinone biosynthesis protein
LRERLPGWLSKAPDMPGLLHDYLKLATAGKLVTRLDPRDLEQSRRGEADSNRRSVRAASGGALFFSGALLTGLETGPWFVYGLSLPGLAIMAIGAVLLIRAHRG